MLMDRSRISRQLDQLSGGTKDISSSDLLESRISLLEEKAEKSIRKAQERIRKRPAISYPKQLPIFNKVREISEAIKTNQVVVISGDTGSGKSTQIPKICLEAGQGIYGKIGCTQPRRIAAQTIATRIAAELGESLGKSVGYKIRFQDRSNPEGYIKIMTDGILLAETQADPFLYEYDTIMIDEAHERSLNIDFLLGILKNLLKKRQELKLIITSATFDTLKFSKAFNNAPVIQIEGRMFPIDVRYMATSPELEKNGDVTYVELAVNAIEKLKNEGRYEDILVFMPTEQDIRDTCELLNSRNFPRTMVLPLFARLTVSQQRRTFSKYSGQKIIVSTNVAETSITIPGIKYVIDTGLARIPRYLPRSRITSLLVGPISKSSSDQRKGRCGRVENGICIRLYSEEDYESRPEYNMPEILRSNLAEVILRMLSLKLGEISEFPFIDRPNPRNINEGFRLLTELRAVTKKNNRYELTGDGRKMALLPLDPRISRIMIEAMREDCFGEVSIIASALSIQDPRERPLEKADQADRVQSVFRDNDSDFISLLNIWNNFYKIMNESKGQNRVRKYAKDHFLSFIRLREWMDVHRQITDIMKERRYGRPKKKEIKEIGTRYDPVHRAILSGYLYNIANKKEKNIYQAAKGREVMLFPGSAIFNRGCQWIVAAEMVKTSRLFARTAARIEPEWIEALGGDQCIYTYSDPYWSQSRGEVLANEQVTLYGLKIVPRRQVSYGRKNQKESHEIFIRSALVNGELRERFPFLMHNRELLRKFEEQEDMLRRRDILTSEEKMAAFYSSRLSGIVDVTGLKKIIRKMGNDDFLKMREEDIVLNRPTEEELSLFPKEMSIDGHKFQYSYRFSPGKEDDGVTIRIPVRHVSSFPAERLDWIVPGFYEEKIISLIRGLPKQYRKQLVPVPEKVRIILNEMLKSEEPLITALSNFIYQRFGVDIPLSEWPVADIADFLKMRISVIDHDGHEVASGRDTDILSGDKAGPVERSNNTAEWKAAKERWERTGITSWDFEDLPIIIKIDEDLIAYPALEPAEGSANIRIFHDMNKALKVHRLGIKLLLSLHLKKEIKFMKRVTGLPSGQSEKFIYFGDVKQYEKELITGFLDRLLTLDIRTRDSFIREMESIKSTIILSASEFMEHVGPVLREYSLLREKLHSLESSNRGNPVILDFVSEIRNELEKLVPREFHKIYPDKRILHLPRYIKAMSIRAERGVNDINKDRGKVSEVEVFTRLLAKMRSELSIHASKEKRASLDELRWVIEEYKVSLFAQELKTVFPVSHKRIQKRIKEVERMI
ncbi:MAG: ATP-dependent RNA helicase HrpA [Deltaproteobacteria bacterium]|nr:ATP-dependent RNA helicase HrpA [Deltaproteobacteria bacterium]